MVPVTHRVGGRNGFVFPASLLLHFTAGMVRLNGHPGREPNVSRTQRGDVFGWLRGGGRIVPRIQELQDLWLSPRLQDKTVHFFSNFCVILMNKSEKDLALFSKPVVDSVLNVTGSSGQLSQGMRFQLG